MPRSDSGNLKFRRALKIKMWIWVLIIFVGLKSAFISLFDQFLNIQLITEKFGIELKNFELLKNIYCILGCLLVVSGIIGVIKNAMLLQNDKKFKTAEVKYEDERNKLIRNTTATVSAYILLIFLSLAVVVSGMFNLIVSLTLLCLLLVYLKILLISYLIVRSKN